ncbi:TIR domain-containing protein [Flavobacterium sp. 5]|uniref:TIR domain-containing protein n=1 Tax=Flavobacterium sp. 5 TaxID=2035199 RepID=UPI000C2BE8D6|nr:TIR domain-containing protein [Flavobacterium sp. 5]PKB15231.1 hypothetical protein CLU82_0295 [Flavobacterium sp. 5]
MNIFVSYTTRNNEVTKNSLINFSNKINSFGKIFVDLIDNNSVDKQARIINELETTHLLILIKSQSTLNSDWVKFELDCAEKLNIPVIEFDITEIDALSQKEIEIKINTYCK